MYPEGMLDRDQRTAKLTLTRHRCSDKEVPNSTLSSFYNFNKNSSIASFSIIKRIISRRTHISYLIWKKGYLTHRYQRLKNVLLVIVYLTLTTLPTTILSAPLRMEPKWVNPCNSNQLSNCHTDSTDFVRKTNASRRHQLLNECLTHVQLAKTSANDYIKNFREFHNYDTLSKYEWLPDIGKEIHEPVPSELLKNLMVEEALPQIYENLQKVAVGLEQIVEDRSNYELNFVPQETKNLRLLCQLRETMATLDICLRPDVSRDIMSQEYRNGDETEKTARAMVIFREYINNLEYAEIVVSHLLKAQNVV